MGSLRKQCIGTTYNQCFRKIYNDTNHKNSYSYTQ